jgi:hypothetical protein
VTDWAQLETRGFVVVRDVLSPADREVLVKDFEQGAPPASYPHGFKLLGRAALARARTSIAGCLDEIRAHCAIRVDVVNFLTLSHYITTSLVERTSFLHQDFDLDYKLTGDHHNYLNFWMPIAKPDADRSNVVVIPFDALAARSPAGHERLAGSGGHRLVPSGGKTAVFGNYGRVLDGTEREPELVLDFDLEELAQTPSIAEGDALIMRGDIIHRTQDAATQRIAASVRVTGSHKRIPRDRVPVADSGDPAATIHEMIHRCYDALKRDEVTIEELERFARGGQSQN